jgi:protoporphyrinogen oxidase
MLMKVAVIGGGLSGLAAAYELAKRDVSVIVFESDSCLGGLAASFSVKEKRIPKTYHHISRLDTVTLDYMRELGLESKLVWRKLGTDFYFNGKPYRLNDPLDIIKFDPLKLRDRLRFGFGLFQCYLSDDASGYEDADSWLDMRVGTEAKKKVFDKLSQIKYGMNLTGISAKWMSRRMHLTARIRDEYAYPVGGLDQLVKGLSKRIMELNGKIFVNRPVTYIPWIYSEYDAVVCTVPAVLLHQMIGKSFGIDYCSAISCVFACNEELVRNYWNVMIDPSYSFGGIFDHTMLCPESASNESEHIYQIFTYANHKLYLRSENSIVETYLRDLRKFGMKTKTNWIRVFKFSFAQPIFKVNYVNPPIKPNSKLYLAGVYREHPMTRTMNSALLSGRKAAMAVLGEKVEES